MKAVEFCYWLQGYFEIHSKAQGRRAGSLTRGQAEDIKKHLALVFKHEIDPSYENSAELTEIHNNGPRRGRFADNDDLIRC